MRTKTSPLILLAAMGLVLAPVGCSDDGTAEEAETSGDGDGDGDAAGDGDGDAAGDGDGDAAELEATIVAEAMGYQGWDLINAAPFQSVGHDGGNAIVNIYVPSDIAAQYRAIDPAAPVETTFPEGSIIVKEHVDAEGNVLAGTVMYKGADGSSESGNWWWGVGDILGGELMNSGQIDGCIGCHTANTVTDWVIGVPAADQTAP